MIPGTISNVNTKNNLLDSIVWTATNHKGGSFMGVDTEGRAISPWRSKVKTTLSFNIPTETTNRS